MERISQNNSFLIRYALNGIDADGSPVDVLSKVSVSEIKVWLEHALFGDRDYPTFAKDGSFLNVSVGKIDANRIGDWRLVVSLNWNGTAIYRNPIAFKVVTGVESEGSETDFISADTADRVMTITDDLSLSIMIGGGGSGSDNIIEEVRLNGVPLEVVDKSVNIDITALQDRVSQIEVDFNETFDWRYWYGQLPDMQSQTNGLSLIVSGEVLPRIAVVEYRLDGTEMTLYEQKLYNQEFYAKISDVWGAIGILINDIISLQSDMGQTADQLSNLDESVAGALYEIKITNEIVHDLQMKIYEVEDSVYEFNEIVDGLQEEATAKWVLLNEVDSRSRANEIAIENLGYALDGYVTQDEFGTAFDSVVGNIMGAVYSVSEEVQEVKEQVEGKAERSVIIRKLFTASESQELVLNYENDMGLYGKTVEISPELLEGARSITFSPISLLDRQTGIDRGLLDYGLVTENGLVIFTEKEPAGVLPGINILIQY